MLVRVKEGSKWSALWELVKTTCSVWAYSWLQLCVALKSWISDKSKVRPEQQCKNIALQRISANGLDLLVTALPLPDMCVLREGSVHVHVSSPMHAPDEFSSGYITCVPQTGETEWLSEGGPEPAQMCAENKAPKVGLGLFKLLEMDAPQFHCGRQVCKSPGKHSGC